MNQRRRVFEPGPEGGNSSGKVDIGGGAVGPVLMEITIACELLAAARVNRS
jgi:hypothetical protein